MNEMLSKIKNKLTNPKRLTTVAIALFLTLSLATAIWYMDPAMTGYAVYKVKSKQPNITIIENLINQTLDTQESNISFERLIKIDSSENQKYMITYLTNKFDNETDNCTNYSDDCVVTYFIGDKYGYGLLQFQELVNGDVYQLKQGLNTITVLTECKRYSCPAEISIEVNLLLKTNE